MTSNRHKRMPFREVYFTDIKLFRHISVRAKMHYSIQTRDRRTWVEQPIEFSFCDATHLAMKFHEFAKALEKQLAGFKRDLHGGQDQ